MSIFNTPKFTEPVGPKILFLHGLEGSSTGSKALKLQAEWGAKCPSLRTDNLLKLRDKNQFAPWASISRKKISKAISEPLQDAIDAINYFKPDAIVASSMGGAILFEILARGIIDPSKTGTVFLAPAIEELCVTDFSEKLENSVWILGEADTIVNNNFNRKKAKSLGANVIYSSGDGHRLSLANETGLINCAVCTTLELTAG